MGYFDNYEKMQDMYKLLMNTIRFDNPNVNWNNIRYSGGYLMHKLSNRAFDDYYNALQSGQIGGSEYDSTLDDIDSMINDLWNYQYMDPTPAINQDPKNFIGTKMSVVPKDSGFIKPVLDSASDAYTIPLEHMDNMYDIDMIKNFHTEPYDAYNNLMVESNLPHANTALARWFKNRGK